MLGRALFRNFASTTRINQVLINKPARRNCNNDINSFFDPATGLPGIVKLQAGASEYGPKRGFFLLTLTFFAASAGALFYFNKTKKEEHKQKAAPTLKK